MTDQHVAWAKRHNPVLTSVDTTSPLTVGNGFLAFTADVTGLQTLYDTYAQDTPLCTMSDLYWHTIPTEGVQSTFDLSDLSMDVYDFAGRQVTYPVNKTPENQAVYDWLRENPHKFNLVRVGFRWKGQEIKAGDLEGIHQELHLETGILESEFLLHGQTCHVKTAVHATYATIGIEVRSPLLGEGLTVDLDFPYGDPGITGANWEARERHITRLCDHEILRLMDRTEYGIRLNTDADAISQEGHRISISRKDRTLHVALAFEPNQGMARATSAAAVFKSSQEWWKKFWTKGGMIDCSEATDPRAMELERRIVLSLYLLAVNSSGWMPPAETGLTCNSWYGKAHLEMHFWHMAWAPLWGHSSLLMRSVDWYVQSLYEAKKNAQRNGFQGVRWPKMVADTAKDSPSPIAVLLVWQQPHILVMLDLIRRDLERNQPDAVPAFFRKYWHLVRETADFMTDFVVQDAQGVYHIEPPVYPVQERYDPTKIHDPAFEIAYWRFGLQIAIAWAEHMQETVNPQWKEVAEHMARPSVVEGFLSPHADIQSITDVIFNDHPSMLQCFGLLPGEDLDPKVVRNTLEHVLEQWDESSLWGWDFAVMAMTATRLGDPTLAVDLLLRETLKNVYVTSGNNRQESRSDLPLYLPGNGSLLLACAMMAAGWDGSADTPGFSGQDGWKIQWEGLLPWYGA